MGADDYIIVYVVAFAPSFEGWDNDTARVLGLDWRPTWEQARDVLLRHLEDGDTLYDYLIRSMPVPKNLSADQVTELLTGKLRELIDIPMPTVWVDG